MARLSGEGAARSVWVASLAVLAFLYGFLACGWGWFPASHITRAIGQARRMASPPAFLAPRVHEGHGVRTARPGDVHPGPTLLASFWESYDWRPGLRLIDRRGQVLHEWRIDPAALFGGGDHRSGGDPGSSDRALVEHEIHGVHLFPDGDVVVNVEHVGTARLDACGRAKWTLAERTHHSIALADDGSLWIPAGEQPDASGASAIERGLDPSTYRDRILRVSPDGRVLEEIDVLSVLVDNGLVRFLALARNTLETPVPGVDLTHLNDVEPLPDSLAGSYPDFEAGDLLVSLRNLDLVLVLDPDTRRVKWHRDGPWLQQHDPDFMGEGWIGVFDNARDGTQRGTLLGGSRIVAVLPGTDSVRVQYPTARSETFYTEILGKWQRLANGNLLLTEGQPGRVVEVAPDGSSVWEWVVPPYDASSVPYVTEGTRYRDLTPEVVAEWPCAGDGGASGDETGGGRAG